MTATGISRFVLALQVKPDSEVTFVQVWSQLAQAASCHPANIEQWLTRGQDGVWYVTSDWLDPDAYTAFSHGPEHEALAAAMRAVTTGASLIRSEHVRHVLSRTPSHTPLSSQLSADTTSTRSRSQA